MEKINELKNMIPEQFRRSIRENRVHIRSHPIDRMLRALESEHASMYEKKYAEKLLEVILTIKKRSPEYFKKTWGSRVLQTKDNYNQAIGTLGEYRCRYILEESQFKVNEIAETNNKKTPDFEVVDYTGQQLFVEVMTPRMNRAAQEKLKNFYEQDTSQLKVKGENELSIQVRTVAVNYMREKNKDRIIELYKRILSNKAEAGQAEEGAINILWLNFEDSDLSISKNDVYPCYSRPFKDIYQTGNFGIWQMLYGKKGDSIFDDLVWLRHYEGRKSEQNSQKYEGYFRQFQQWNGIVMSFHDCQVFHQNPWSELEIPVKSKQWIMRLQSFDLNASWIDETNKYLCERVEAKRNELQRIHQIFKEY
ncbi:hypothetical protein [Paenibacillus xylanexedens]|uniref:hypothetical protein n=1 Tax=Paenibacillus xylanexedens TaxID=528191 RepID=UPI0011A234A1|nr:hypothetical protein [Paenibacillus xylanexedens]